MFCLVITTCFRYVILFLLLLLSLLLLIYVKAMSTCFGIVNKFCILYSVFCTSNDNLNPIKLDVTLPLLLLNIR